MKSRLRRIGAVGCVWLSGLGPVAAEQIDQSSIVYIEAACAGAEAGAVDHVRGSGVIVNKDGYVVNAFAVDHVRGSGVIINRTGYVITAYNVIECWLGQSLQQQDAQPIIGHIGDVGAPGITMGYVDHREPADIAVLRFLGAPGADVYHPARACALRDPVPGAAFTTAGFPNGRDYRVIEGRIGATGASGRWAAEVAFDPAMSGAPVYVDGRVVGLVKGGEADSGYVTPIYLGESLIEPVLGGFLYNCPRDPLQQDDKVAAPQSPFDGFVSAPQIQLEIPASAHEISRGAQPAAPTAPRRDPVVDPLRSDGCVVDLGPVKVKRATCD